LLKYIKRTIKVLLIIKAPACGLFWARRRLTWVHVVSDRIFPAGGKDWGDFGGDRKSEKIKMDSAVDFDNNPQKN
jgi:hypothetical protein